MRELSLFTGAGGGLLGSLILGWRTVAAVEIDPYCQRVLCARGGCVADAEYVRCDGSGVGAESGSGQTGTVASIREAFPVHGDIRTFHPIPGSCDIVTGGFPCQPFSQAGRRLGEDDPRNMWPHAVRVLRESGAPLGFFENVPGLLSSGYFGTVLGDLAEAGFDAEWCVLGADDVGAPHRRKRLWILAYREGYRWEQGGAESAREFGGLDVAECGSPWWCDPADVPDPERGGCEPARECGGLEGVGGRGQDDAVPPAESGSYPADVGDANQGVRGWGLSAGQGQRREPTTTAGASCRDATDSHGESQDRAPESWRERDIWLAEPYVGRVATGVASRVDRLRALGNGQVPQTMAAAFTYLAREAGVLRR